MSADALVVLDGTVRAREPEHTHRLLAPRLARYGITRVARLTGLDCLGLPVATAIRPAARTLAASQGKGATDLLAWLSATMEAVELWHAEQPRDVVLHTSAADARAPYPMSALPLRVHHDVLEHLPLDWVAARTVADGDPVLLPADLLRRTPYDPLSVQVLRATSTGLAAGNTWAEAALHAMYEVVERDALHADDLEDGRRRIPVDPNTVTDPYCRSLLERLHQARAVIELHTVTNAYRLPVCRALIWSEEYPRFFGGAGCHADPHIALSRAITEAAQSRLTSIAGTRCDLPSDDPAFVLQPARPPAPAGLTPWTTATVPFDRTPPRTALDAQTHALAARIELATGYPPIAATLSAPDEPVTVLQVVCPGTHSRTTRSLTR
ncbi:YcaO-like family protein [Kitasatospora sp. NPDC059803]|uniref:YcaO-like family protein n=1 Tax=Kitasatospora sp. NPDC059803 TaxID=3346953 RepID=UPI00365D3C38